MTIPQPLVDAVVHELAKLPAELVEDAIALIRRVASSSDPKDSIARAAQVLAHQKLADAALDAAFEGKKHVPGSGV